MLSMEPSLSVTIGLVFERVQPCLPSGCGDDAFQRLWNDCDRGIDELYSLQSTTELRWKGE
jgi:hypothetical protein